MAAVRKHFRRKIGHEFGPLQTKCKAELCDLFLENINKYLKKVEDAVRAWDGGESTDSVIWYLRGAEEFLGRIEGQRAMMKKLNMPDVLRFFEEMYNDSDLDRAGQIFNDLWEKVL
jgi:hypothetical protein